ncbi:MAG: hypothetical protein EOP49_40625 [Sphingobacteriales bacterium]|nr:MAG: hypothetical protein EOP49_40625 [Sphingobacteriales bacterium]
MIVDDAKENQRLREDMRTITAANNQKMSINRPEGPDRSATASLALSPKKEIIDRNVNPVENSMAKAAMLDDEETNDNHILFMDEDKIAQTKTGAFFKKLKRTVVRSANIKTGNSIKIAGFEFAVK